MKAATDGALCHFKSRVHGNTPGLSLRHHSPVQKGMMWYGNLTVFAARRQVHAQTSSEACRDFAEPRSLIHAQASDRLTVS